MTHHSIRPIFRSFEAFISIYKQTGGNHTYISNKNANAFKFWNYIFPTLEELMSVHAATIFRFNTLLPIKESFHEISVPNHSRFGMSKNYRFL